MHRNLKRNRNRGGIGFIVLLIVVLIVAVLAMQNFQKANQNNPNTMTITGTDEVTTPTSVIDKFKGDAKRIEELEAQHLPDLAPPQ